MNWRDDKGIILIAVGIVLTITIVFIFIGIPLIIVGAYFLNKKVSNQSKDLDNKLKDKRNELANIDTTLDEMEQEKEDEINEKLKNKKDELANIDEKLEKMEKDKEKEIDEKLKEKENKLSNIDYQLDEIGKQKEKEINEKLKDKKNQLNNLVIKINNKENELVLVEDELNLQSYGLYEPKYNFIDSTSYKERLDDVRKEQKQMIKDKTAAISITTWEIDGDKRKGAAFTNANIKQILRNFNLESEIIINKVKHSNIENSKKRLQKSYDQLNKLYDREYVKITQHFLDLKFDEMYIAFEYEMKKQEEKEILHEEREREREEKKVQKELDAQEKKINKQKESLDSELKEIELEITNKNNEEKEKLKDKIKELKIALAKSDEEIKQIADKRKRTGAGYVYIISNVGSFGDNIFKIGVTRRDKPEERVRELSSASVPFRYDTHLFIFSKEAFDLEKELHKKFHDKRVNKINMRKEFFYITLDDVKKIVGENKDLVHSFQEKAEAQEYYDTLKIQKKIS